MTDNNIVSVLDCDVYFEKLKDRPDFIKFYLEFKTISIYLNKINTILELVNGYTNNLELISEQLEEMSNILLEVYADNSNSNELTLQKDNLVLYCDEIDTIVQNSIFNDVTLFNQYKTIFKSISGSDKTISIVDKTILNIENFKIMMVYHGGVFFYTCFVYTDYTNYSTSTEYNGKIIVTGDTISIADSDASPSTLQTNLSITIDSSALANHDTIYISNVDNIHFLLGDNKDYYDFPTVRFNTNILSFDKTNIKTATEQSTFDTLETNIETAITNNNKLFSTYGNIKNIMKIRHKRLHSRYNSLTKIIKQYCPELNI